MATILLTIALAAFICLALVGRSARREAIQRRRMRARDLALKRTLASESFGTGPGQKPTAP